MNAPRRLVVVVVAALTFVASVALSSCGTEQSTARGTGAAPGTGAASAAEDLFSTIDAALAQETSVRQEMGNLTPPPPVVLAQEYGGDRDQLALTVDLGPRSEPMRIYRVDGLLYVEGQDPVPMSEVGADDTALIAALAHTDVRRDFRRMARLADDFSYVGEEQVRGVDTRHYRLTLTLAPGDNPGSLPSRIVGESPADLWVAADGLPVRMEVEHSEPLNGVPGTGVSRTDYLAWSEPLGLDPESLDWD